MACLRLPNELMAEEGWRGNSSVPTQFLCRCAKPASTSFQVSVYKETIEKGKFYSFALKIIKLFAFTF